MGKWQKFRLILLGATLGSVVLAVAKITLYPVSGPRGFTPYNFPDSIPLPEWQFVGSQELTTTKKSDVLVGHKYEYIRDNVSLDIEMRYAVLTIADVDAWMRSNGVLKSRADKLSLQKIDGIGFYGRFTTKDRTYLGSCINPRGQTTVTKDQFRYNRNTVDLQIGRLLLWSIGQLDLQDRRCLLTQMSLPIKANSTPEVAEKLLETTWVSWHQWWQSRFPPL